MDCADGGLYTLCVLSGGPAGGCKEDAGEHYPMVRFSPTLKDACPTSKFKDVITFYIQTIGHPTSVVVAMMSCFIKPLSQFLLPIITGSPLFPIVGNL